MELKCLAALVFCASVCSAELFKANNTLKEISYYGHRTVREGCPFVVVCFSDASREISWTKNGWPVESVFPNGYSTSQHTGPGNVKVSWLRVHNAQSEHTGLYRCLNTPSSSHRISVLPYVDSPLGVTVTDCLNVMPNESLKLRCNVPARTINSTSISWYKDGRPIARRSRSTLSTLEIHGAGEADTGTYSCSSAGRTTSEGHEVELHRVVTPIRIAPFPPSLQAHWGATIRIRCRARASPRPHVAWYLGAQRLYDGCRPDCGEEPGHGPHVQQSTLTLRKVEPSDGGVYTCIASHEHCDDLVTQRSFQLYVPGSQMRTNEEYPGVGITLDPSSESLRLHCIDSANPAAKIKWMKGDLDIDNYTIKHKFTRDADDQSLIIHNPTADDVDNYTCIAVGTGGQAVILVGLKAEIQERSTPPSGRMEGMKVYMHCKVSGIPLPVVHWFKNNKLVQVSQHRRFSYRASAGVFPDTLEIAMLSRDDSGTYSCMADNGHSQDIRKFEMNVKTKMEAILPFLLICGEVVAVCALAYKYLEQYREGAGVHPRQQDHLFQPEVAGEQKPPPTVREVGSAYPAAGRGSFRGEVAKEELPLTAKREAKGILITTGPGKRLRWSGFDKIPESQKPRGRQPDIEVIPEKVDGKDRSYIADVQSFKASALQGIVKFQKAARTVAAGRGLRKKYDADQERETRKIIFSTMKDKDRSEEMLLGLDRSIGKKHAALDAKVSDRGLEQLQRPFTEVEADRAVHPGSGTEKSSVKSQQRDIAIAIKKSTPRSILVVDIPHRYSATESLAGAQPAATRGPITETSSELSKPEVIQGAPQSFRKEQVVHPEARTASMSPVGPGTAYPSATGVASEITSTMPIDASTDGSAMTTGTTRKSSVLEESTAGAAFTAGPTVTPTAMSETTLQSVITDVSVGVPAGTRTSASPSVAAAEQVIIPPKVPAAKPGVISPQMSPTTASGARTHMGRFTFAHTAAKDVSVSASTQQLTTPPHVGSSTPTSTVTKAGSEATERLAAAGRSPARAPTPPKGTERPPAKEPPLKVPVPDSPRRRAAASGKAGGSPSMSATRPTTVPAATQTTVPCAGTDGAKVLREGQLSPARVGGTEGGEKYGAKSPPPQKATDIPGAVFPTSSTSRAETRGEVSQPTSPTASRKKPSSSIGYKDSTLPFTVSRRTAGQGQDKTRSAPASGQSSVAPVGKPVAVAAEAPAGVKSPSGTAPIPEVRKDGAHKGIASIVSPGSGSTATSAAARRNGEQSKLGKGVEPAPTSVPSPAAAKDFKKPAQPSAPQSASEGAVPKTSATIPTAPTPTQQVSRHATSPIGTTGGKPAVVAVPSTEDKAHQEANHEGVYPATLPKRENVGILKKSATPSPGQGEIPHPEPGDKARWKLLDGIKNLFKPKPPERLSEERVDAHDKHEGGQKTEKTLPTLVLPPEESTVSECSSLHFTKGRSDQRRFISNGSTGDETTSSSGYEIHVSKHSRACGTSALSTKKQAGTTTAPFKVTAKADERQRISKTVGTDKVGLGSSAITGGVAKQSELMDLSKPSALSRGISDVLSPKVSDTASQPEVEATRGSGAETSKTCAREPPPTATTKTKEDDDTSGVSTSATRFLHTEPDTTELSTSQVVVERPLDGKGTEQGRKIGTETIPQPSDTQKSGKSDVQPGHEVALPTGPGALKIVGLPEKQQDYGSPRETEKTHDQLVSTASGKHEGDGSRIPTRDGHQPVLPEKTLVPSSESHIGTVSRQEAGVDERSLTTLEDKATAEVAHSAQPTEHSGTSGAHSRDETSVYTTPHVGTPGTKEEQTTESGTLVERSDPPTPAIFPVTEPEDSAIRPVSPGRPSLAISPTAEEALLPSEEHPPVTTEATSPNVSPSLRRAVMDKACRRGLLQSVKPSFIVHKDEKIEEEPDAFHLYYI